MKRATHLFYQERIRALESQLAAAYKAEYDCPVCGAVVQAQASGAPCSCWRKDPELDWQLHSEDCPIFISGYVASRKPPAKEAKP